MDREVLTILQEALHITSQARCGLEAEVAVATVVNTDLQRIASRLKARAALQSVSTAMPLRTGSYRQRLSNAQHQQQSMASQHRLQQHVVGQQSISGHPPSHPAICHQKSSSTSRAGQSNNPVVQPASKVASLSRAVHTGISSSMPHAGTQPAQRSRGNKVTPKNTARPGSASKLGVPTQQPVAATASPTVPASMRVLLAEPAGQQQPEQPSVSAAATVPPDLPAEMRGQVAAYNSLQQQLGNLLGIAEQQQSQPPTGVTRSAAAGFVKRLEQAFGASSVRQQRQQQGPQLLQQQAPAEVKQTPLTNFVSQAQFVGLTAAALFAIKALSEQDTGSCSSNAADTFAQAVQQQCKEWLQEHNSEAQQARQQQAAAEMLESAVRWRNRSMRALLGHAVHAAAEGASADSTSTHTVLGSIGHKGQAAPGTWLPVQCWRLLLPSDGHNTAAPGNHAGSNSCILSNSSMQPPWHPQLQLATVLQQPASGASSAREMTAAAQQLTLCYSAPQEMQQHSKQLQKLPQLLLQLHMESRVVARLLEALLKGCLALQPSGQSQQIEQQHLGMTGAGAAAGLTDERCLALYRLICGLSGSVAKRHGLNSCLAANEEMLPGSTGLGTYQSR